ncbi:MAG: hypothetical protein ABIL09_07980 [Gemmatimonadota bacterium]
MTLCLCTPAQLAALPAGTRYRMLCDREDLWAVGGVGAKCIELAAAVPGVPLVAAPKTYPNGVDILKGALAEWREAAGPRAAVLATTDAAELSAAIARLRQDPEAEAKLADLVAPFIVEKVVGRG